MLIQTASPTLQCPDAAFFVPTVLMSICDWLCSVLVSEWAGCGVSTPRCLLLLASMMRSSSEAWTMWWLLQHDATSTSSLVLVTSGNTILVQSTGWPWLRDLQKAKLCLTSTSEYDKADHLMCSSQQLHRCALTSSVKVPVTQNRLCMCMHVQQLNWVCQQHKPPMVSLGIPPCCDMCWQTPQTCELLFTATSRAFSNAATKIFVCVVSCRSGAVNRLYKAHIATLTHRVNTLTNVRYRDDPAIMGWDVLNEPRCPGCGEAGEAAHDAWLADMSSALKASAPNQLVLSGTEGFFSAAGSGNNSPPCETTTAWSAFSCTNLYISSWQGVGLLLNASGFSRIWCGLPAIGIASYPMLRIQPSAHPYGNATASVFFWCCSCISAL